MLQCSTTNLHTKRTKSAFYAANNEVSIFISADFCVQVYLYTQQQEYVLKTFTIFLPEANKSSIISCLKVIHNTLYCFAHVQSENSILSELFLYDLSKVTENHEDQQQVYRFISTNIKINDQIRFFGITEQLIGVITESNNIYVYDIVKNTQQFEKIFGKKSKQIRDISGYHGIGQNIFAMVAEDVIMIMSQNYQISEYSLGQEASILKKDPEMKFNFVHVQANVNSIFLVNSDGKTFELSEDGKIMRWQCIKERTLKAISSFIITKSDSHYDDQKKFKMLQIITFNQCVVKENDLSSFRYKGKVDICKMFSVVQNQDIVNCYLFQEKTILITEKCGIIVMRCIFDDNDKITHAKFQANSQGFYCDDIKFGLNTAVGQQNQLLFIQKLGESIINIHEHMVTKHKINHLNGDNIYTLHLLDHCKEKNVCNPQYNISNDNMIGEQYCISKYNINKQMYKYFVKFPFVQEQIVSMKSHITNEQQELLVLFTEKKHLFALFSIPPENRHICYVIPNLQVKYYDVSYDYNRQQYIIIYINMKDEVMYLQFTIQDFINQQFKPKLVYRNTNIDSIFYFKFYKDLLFLGLILQDKESNVLQSKVLVYHIKQLHKMSKQYADNKANDFESNIPPLDEMVLNTSYNYDAMPVDMQINEFTDYTTCVFFAQYKKCTKLYSLLCKEALQTFFQVGRSALTANHFVITMDESYHVFRIDESLLAGTAFYTYLYTDSVGVLGGQEQYEQVVQDMVEHMTTGEHNRLMTPASVERPRSGQPELKELRSRLTDRQSSVILSQLRPEQGDQGGNDGNSGNNRNNPTGSAIKLADLATEHNNNNQDSNDSLSYNPDHKLYEIETDEVDTQWSGNQNQEWKRPVRSGMQGVVSSQSEAKLSGKSPLFDGKSADELREAVSNTIRTKFADGVSLPERCVSESVLNIPKNLNLIDRGSESVKNVPGIDYESLLSTERLSIASDGQMEFNDEQLSLQLKKSLDALDEQDLKRAKSSDFAIMTTNSKKNITDDLDNRKITSQLAKQGKESELQSSRSKQNEETEDGNEKVENEEYKSITLSSDSSSDTRTSDPNQEACEIFSDLEAEDGVAKDTEVGNDVDNDVGVETQNEVEASKQPEKESNNQLNNEANNEAEPRGTGEGQSVQSPAPLNQSMSLQLLNGLQMINQSLQKTVKNYEISQDGVADADLAQNKELIKKEVNLLANTLDRINLLLGIEDEDSIKNQLKNITMTLLGMTNK